MFGASNNTGFGAFGSTQTSTAAPFGKPAAPAFGFGTQQRAPAFGSAAPVFGATQTQPAATGGFGGFGGAAAPGTGLFGTQQQQQSAPLFGASSSAAPVFGAQPAGAGVVTAGGAGGFSFGVQPTAASAPAAAGGSLFGQPTAAAAAGNTFGTATNTSGTTLKFNPVVANDSVTKGNTSETIKVKLMSITVMNEYANKSFEELRVEDYMANRKGAQTMGTGFGQPAGTGLFGSAVSSTGGTGLFGSAQSKPLFGSSTASTGVGLFGAPAQNTVAGGGLFGAAKPTGFVAPTASSAAPTFGGFGPTGTGATSGFLGATNQQANKPLFGNTTGATGGLFGANTGSQPAGTGFGTTPAFGSSNVFGATSSVAPTPAAGAGFSFGTAGSQPAAGTGGFGGFGQAKPATGGLFGSTAPVFGQPAAPASSGGFSFGAAKPAAPASTGFSFGQPAVGSGFGASSSLGAGAGGGSLFGATPAAAKPGGLFGAPAGATSTGGGGLFGGSGGFGSFGTSTSTAAPTFGGFGSTQPGTGLFGQPTAAAGAVPGSQQFQQQSQQLPLSGANPAVSQAHQLIMSLTANQFGNAPLFKNLPKSSSLSRQELLKLTSPNVHKSITETTPYRVPTEQTSRAQLRTNTASSGQASLFDGLDDEPSGSVDALTPRRSVKKLDIRAALAGSPAASSPAAAAGRSLVCQPKADVSASPLATPSSLRQPAGSRVERLTAETETPELLRCNLASPVITDRPAQSSADDTLALMGMPKGSTSAAATPDTGRKRTTISESAGGGDPLSDVSRLDDTLFEDESSAISSADPSDHPPHASGVTLRRVGYYTLPPLDDLQPDPDTGRLRVTDLTIGRHAYGSVYFSGVTDITGLNLDAIVHIRRREVCVYPDDADKPAVGEGLNRSAQVTLERVWPTDKTTRQPVTDPARLGAIGWEQRLERTCLRLGAKFVEYRPETGSWVFKVDHFSKYGLNDSDDEEEPQPASLATRQLPASATVAAKQLKVPAAAAAAVNGTAAAAASVLGDGSAAAVADPVTSTAGTIVNSENGEATVTPSAGAMASLSTRAFSLDPDNVQYMKLSLFADDDDEGIVDDAESQPGENQLPSASDPVRSSVFRAGLLSSLPNSAPSPLRHLPPTSLPAAAATPPLPLAGGLGGSFRLNLDTSLSQRILESSRSAAIDTPEPAEMADIEKFGVAPVTNTANDASRLAALDSTAMDQCPPVELECHRELLPVVPAHFGSLRSVSKSNRVLSGYQLADLGSLFGCRWRVGWAPTSALVHSTVTSANAGVASLGDTPPFSVYDRPSVYDGIVNEAGTDSAHDLAQDEYTRLMMVLLDHSTAYQSVHDLHTGQTPTSRSSDSVPLLVTNCDVSLLTELAAVDTRWRSVWQLLVALWGVPENKRPLCDDTDECRQYSDEQWRKQALSDWLQSVCLPAAQREIDSLQASLHRLDKNSDTDRDDVYMDMVFAHLTVKQIYEAVSLAHEHGDMRLALLLSQIDSCCDVRALISTQLHNWHLTGADRFISVGRLRVFVLIAGLSVWETSDHTIINIFDKLDWKRSFALHLWYLCSPTDSIRQVFLQYQTSWSSSPPLSCRPLPLHSPNLSPPSHLHDLSHQLLELFSIPATAAKLDQLLTPRAHTHQLLDHRLSWLLHEALICCGFRQLPADRVVRLHAALAEQLRAGGSWQLTVFVLQHIEDDQCRRAACSSVLTCHVTLDLTLETESLLCDRLGVPRYLLASAMAVLARHLRRPRLELELLLDANRWQQSHDLLLESLAPQCVIDEEHEWLGSILCRLAEHSGQIHGWSDGALIYVHYMAISRVVSDALASSEPTEERIERVKSLRPTLLALCDKINQFKCPTPVHRLCRVEMSRQCVSLLRILSCAAPASAADSASISADSAQQLLSRVDQLQLPEDYALEELTHALHMYVQQLDWQH